MAQISIIPGMKRLTNQEFLKKACDCEPELIHTEVHPVNLVRVENKGGIQPKVTVVDRAAAAKNYPQRKGDRLCFDFGDHQVGYVTLTLNQTGSPQDAPAFVKLKFGEIAKEIIEDSADYDGWISRGWIQEEYLHFDMLPTTIRLPRRYAFRYFEITTIDTSAKFSLIVEAVSCDAVSCVKLDDAPALHTDHKLFERLDRVSLRTLQNCMQTVFEDGPKRDRRLWLGDLRLQALANYKTFRNTDLVKRCLYLFGGLTRDDGRIGACLFTEPKYLVDDTFLFDYSLFFINTLLDYYKETTDIDTLRDLWPIARRQLELSADFFYENNLVKPLDGFWCFIDWQQGLNKQAAAQAVYIYAAKAAVKIADILNDNEAVRRYSADIELKTAAAMTLFEPESGLFVSGMEHQLSCASQVWMILAGVVTPKAGKEMLSRIRERGLEKEMVSPYMNHHYVEALLVCGEKALAKEHLNYYWGGMLEHGADTFWELYNPVNPSESPYGSSIVNSYCHAWSCTPTYLIRTFFQDEQ